SASDEHKLSFVLRSSSGDTQSKLTPLSAPDSSVN
ncbi:MAG: hypothetical protein JWN41_951, partial [Thermoleophilia bacterium]|nr:hypothetical protein [Thermoleophilia bacterium]